MCSRYLIPERVPNKLNNQNKHLILLAAQKNVLLPSNQSAVSDNLHNQNQSSIIPKNFCLSPKGPNDLGGSDNLFAKCHHQKCITFSLRNKVQYQEEMYFKWKQRNHKKHVLANITNSQKFYFSCIHVKPKKSVCTHICCLTIMTPRKSNSWKYNISM